MSLEQQWENEQEWNSERGELEINSERLSKSSEICLAKKCRSKAFKTYDVIESGQRFSHMEISLCDVHASHDEAFELYRDFNHGI